MGSGTKTELAVLAIQIGERPFHCTHSLGADAAARVKHPIDGGQGQPGLAGDVGEAVRTPWTVRHSGSVASARGAEVILR